jgi:putative DNA primase/helicase
MKSTLNAAACGKGYCAQNKRGFNRRTEDNVHPHHPEIDFLDAMQAHGIAPNSGCIVGDGHLHRYRILGDTAGSKNGWYVLYLDGVASGAFGSWKHDISRTWCSRAYKSLSYAERNVLRERTEILKLEQEKDLREFQLTAADRAVSIWKSAQQAPANHPYLVRKRINPGVARLYKDSLTLPLIDPTTFAITSLQFIQPDGSKLLLSGGRKRGCFIPITPKRRSGAIILAEGFATAMSVAELRPLDRVYAAVDAGNLEPVARAIRERKPKTEIIIAGDADKVGQAKARAAALAVGGKLLIPTFPAGSPSNFTDWNDWVRAVKMGGAV